MILAVPQGTVRVLAAVSLGVSLVACATPASPSEGVVPSGVAPLASDPSVLAPADAASPATGVIVRVDAAGLDDVRGFRLRTTDGVVIDLTVGGPLENAAEFPLGHLGEHVASSEPVRVWFRRSGGVLVVTRVEDAG